MTQLPIKNFHLLIPSHYTQQNSSSSFPMETMSSSTNGFIFPRVQAMKSKGRAGIAPKSQMQPSKASASIFKPPLSIKVFEDQAKGILCYRDEKGELVCEGYDEGPRFIRHPQHKTYYQRCTELEIPEFLTQRWLQILEDHN